MKINLYYYRDSDNIINSAYVEEIKRLFENSDVIASKYNTSDVKKTFLSKLPQLGWSYEFKIDSKSNLTITSVQGKTGLCFQTGNHARVYADLLKLQKLYVDGVINSAIYIIPSKRVSNIFGNNVACAEKLVKELKIFNYVITVPITIIEFD